MSYIEIDSCRQNFFLGWAFYDFSNHPYHVALIGWPLYSGAIWVYINIIYDSYNMNVVLI